MDQDGLFLILSMCNSCRTGKGSWKKCMGKRHNPRLATIPKEKLSFAHRQCVKPDETMTIYKLRNHETNEEFLEFSEDIVFQTPCADCSNIKACLNAGHRLADWQPILSDRDAKPSSGNGLDDGHDAGVGPPSSSPQSKERGGGRSKAGATGRGRKGAEEAAATSAGGGRPGRAGGKGSPRGSATGDVPPSPKNSHKRKSPGAVTTPPTKNIKVSTPRSTGSSASSQGKVGKPPAKDKAVKRGGKDRHSYPGGTVSIGVGGGSKSHKKMSSNGHPGVAPVKSEEVDGDAALDVNERPLKRRGEETSAGAVYTPKDDGDENSEADDSGTAGDTEVPAPPPPPPKPMTIAEKLEAVKLEEAELLKEFQATHDKCAEDEGAKRAEIAAFQLAGEAAIKEMRRKKEEALIWISERRQKIAAERATLVKHRIKGEDSSSAAEERKVILSRVMKDELKTFILDELEAEQAKAREEAQERESRLQAEKDALSKAVSSQELFDIKTPGGGDGWLSTDSGEAATPPNSVPTAGASLMNPTVTNYDRDAKKGGADNDVKAPLAEGSDASAANSEGVDGEGHEPSTAEEASNGLLQEKQTGFVELSSFDRQAGGVNGAATAAGAAIQSGARASVEELPPGVADVEAEKAILGNTAKQSDGAAEAASGKHVVKDGMAVANAEGLPVEGWVNGNGDEAVGGEGIASSKNDHAPKVDMEVCLRPDGQTVLA